PVSVRKVSDPTAPDVASTDATCGRVSPPTLPKEPATSSFAPVASGSSWLTWPFTLTLSEPRAPVVPSTCARCCRPTPLTWVKSPPSHRALPTGASAVTGWFTVPGANPVTTAPVDAETAPSRFRVETPPSEVKAPPTYTVAPSPLRASDRTMPPLALVAHSRAPEVSSLPRPPAGEPARVVKSPPTYTPSEPTTRARTGAFAAGAQDVTAPV